MAARGGLAEYNKKRDFSRTAEPKGERRKSGKKLSYLIQKHDASRLHYDFRLEWDGKLMSWAVPKGPSESTSDVLPSPGAALVTANTVLRVPLPPNCKSVRM